MDTGCKEVRCPRLDHSAYSPILLFTFTLPSGPRQAEREKKLKSGSWLARWRGASRQTAWSLRPAGCEAPHLSRCAQGGSGNLSTSRAPSVLRSPFAAPTQARRTGTGPGALLPPRRQPPSLKKPTPGSTRARRPTSCLKANPRPTTSPPATSSSAPGSPGRTSVISKLETRMEAENESNGH